MRRDTIQLAVSPGRTWSQSLLRAKMRVEQSKEYTGARIVARRGLLGQVQPGMFPPSWPGFNYLSLIGGGVVVGKKSFCELSK